MWRQVQSPETVDLGIVESLGHTERDVVVVLTVGKQDGGLGQKPKMQFCPPLLPWYRSSMSKTLNPRFQKSGIYFTEPHSVYVIPCTRMTVRFDGVLGTQMA